MTGVIANIPAAAVENVTTPTPSKDHRDCGRAWLVLVGSFFGGMLSLGNALALGVLFNHIVAAMPAGASTPAINMIFALTAALTYMGGTASPSIIARIGFRYTMLIGSVLAVIGYLGAAFSTQVWHLYITLGFITGLGFGFIFTPSVGVVGQHFNKYKHFAVTTATMGIPLGIIIFSMFHHHIAQAAGFKAAMLANAGASACLVICAFAVKDPPKKQDDRQTKRNNNRRGSVTHDFIQKISQLSLHMRTVFFPRRASAEPIVVKVARDNSCTTQIVHLEQQGAPTFFVATVAAADSTAADAAASESDSSGRESPSINAAPLLSTPATNDKLATLPSTDANISPPMPKKQRERPLICMPKMWCLLVEGLTLLSINIYLIITPVYLVRTHRWSKSHAALVIMTHGVSSIIFRVLVMAVNAYPRLGDRISKSLQAGVGVVCVLTCSVAYFFSYFLPTSNDSTHVMKSGTFAGTHTMNLTSTFNTTTAAAPLQHTGSIFHEPNALYFLGFALINGAGHTFFLAYQPSIVLEVLGAQNLTRAFGYMSFVWGAACLVLYPLAGKLGDVFGSLHIAYLLACACCVLSGLALIVLVVIHRAEVNRTRKKRITLGQFV